MKWVLGMVCLAPCVLGRELATDRPDTTESAMTVPKGRFQVEAEVLAHSWNDGRSASFTVGESLLKYGVTDVSVNFGGTYRFTPECQLDAGIRVGLAGEVEDAQLFLGWSQRF